MDVQVQNAIEIAWNPASDQNLKAQAFEFLNQLRNDPSGWQVCLDLFTRTPQTSEVVRLVSLEVVNNAVQSLDNASLVYLKDNLVEYIKRVYGGLGGQTRVDSSGLQNKLTQTFTYIFIALYKQGWDTFMDDFLSLLGPSNGSQGDNVDGVAFYLRMLNAIHEEIADTLVTRQGSETKRNTDIKDLLRARDIPKVAISWKNILNRWKDQNDVILEMCLKVIGRWVSWIDISLVVNQEILNLLFQLAGRPGNQGCEDKVRNAAIDTFTEIVGKKMKTSDKIEMIIFLNLGNVVSQLVSSSALHEFRSTSNYDNDLAEAVAKLVNTAVFDIVKALEDSQAGAQVKANADELLQTFLPLLLRFFSDDYDEICSTVIPSLTDLLTFLRKAQPLPSHYSATLSPILNAIIMKMRYDETSSWGLEDEQTDEAEFQELRKRLHVLQKSVAAVDESLYIEALSNVVANTFQNLEQQGGQMDWRDIDLALHEMYLFGELALPNSGMAGKSQPSTVAAERLSAMMAKMLDSGIATFNHPAIQLQYMEICVRYYAFFEAQPTYIPQVLEHFVRLVHGNHIRLKTRSWYLFHRLVKYLRNKISGMAETVITSINDLLPIKAVVPEDSGNDDMSSDESDHSADALFTSQLYLFEAIGSISSTADTPVEKQVLYVRSIIDPLFADMERHLAPAKAGDAQALLQTHHDIMALGTLAYGFSETVPGGSSAPRKVPAEPVSLEFSRAAEAILVALEATKFNIEVRTASRAAFSRCVGVLGARILPQLPRWIDGLLSERSSNDEMAMFLRLLDQVVFGFKSEIYSVLDSLLTPLLQRIFTGLSKPVTGTDDEIQLTELRREYLSFVLVILNNDLGSTLVSESNQAMFEPLINSVVLLAKNVSHGTGNLPGSKLAFSVLTRMVTLWGGPDVAQIVQSAQAPASPAPSTPLPGFDQFMIERFNPICWDVLRDQQFRPSSDAQAKHILVEIAALLQTIYSKTGSMFIDHLQRSYFPALGMDGSSFIQSMTISDKKAFSAFLQAFLKQRG